jgi:hypothetical protein
MNIKYFFLLFLFIFSFYLFFPLKIFAQDFENLNNLSIEEFEILNKADEYIAGGNISEGLRLLFDGIKKYKKSYAIPKKLGEIFYKEELYPLALKYLKLAYNKGDKTPYLISLIADTFAYLNDDLNAIKWFEKSFKKDIYQPYNFYSYIWVLLKIEKYNLAKQKIDEYYDFFKGYSYLDSALAVLYANIGDYEKSKKYYQKVLSLSGNYNGTILYNWGILEYSFYNFDEAFSLFMKSYTNSDMPESFLALGSLLSSALKFDLAYSFFITGLEKLQAPLILYNLFDLNKLKGDFNKANNFALKILSFKNENWIYRYNLNKNEHLSNHYKFLIEHEKLKIKIEKALYKENLFDNLFKKLNLLKEFLNKKYYILMKRYYNIKSLKKHDFEFSYINYYKRLLEIFDWNKYIYKNILSKLENLYKKFFNDKTGTIYFLYLEYAHKFNDLNTFSYYENIFLQTYNKNYEKDLYLNYLFFKADINYKHKNYDKYFNAIFEILKINYLSLKNIDVPILANLQFFNLSKKEKNIFKNYFQLNNIVEKKYDKILKYKNLIFKINIEKIDDKNFSIYIIEPFESKISLSINLNDLSLNNFELYEIFNLNL